MPTSASNVSPCTSSRSEPSGWKSAGSSSRAATARTRRPAPASRSFSARTRSLPASTGISDPSASLTYEERASRTSGAPLTKQRTTACAASSISWNVAINLYSESKGTSPTRGYARLVASTSTPPFSARTTSAASVGSPTISASRTAASLASAIGSRKGSSGVSVSPATRRIVPSVEYPSPSIEKRRPTTTSSRAVIWFSVSVPVLSEQIADVDPRVSTERSRFTIAPFAASACVPSESTS